MSIKGLPELCFLFTFIDFPILLWYTVGEHFFASQESIYVPYPIYFAFGSG